MAVYTQALRYFVPRCRQDELLTVEAIADNMSRDDPGISLDTARAYANKIHGESKQLYATLLCIDK